MERSPSHNEPSRDELVLTEVLHALSDALRLEIVRAVACTGALACGAFSFAASIPKSSLSHHFRVLRESGVLSTRREGKALINCLRQEDLEARFPGLLKSILAALPAPGPERKQKVAGSRQLRQTGETP
ncbi:MAG: helix-turn-helix domain-containing protein [Cystobacter sp.]